MPIYTHLNSVYIAVQLLLCVIVFCFCLYPYILSTQLHFLKFKICSRIIIFLWVQFCFFYLDFFPLQVCVPPCFCACVSVWHSANAGMRQTSTYVLLQLVLSSYIPLSHLPDLLNGSQLMACGFMQLLQILHREPTEKNRNLWKNTRVFRE